MSPINQRRGDVAFFSPRFKKACLEPLRTRQIISLHGKVHKCSEEEKCSTDDTDTHHICLPPLRLQPAFTGQSLT